MSLLKWKELAKKKSELGDKINYVHNAITKHKIGEQTSQQSLAKVFKPVTSKLDDVIDSNLMRIPARKKRQQKKGEVPNYGIYIDDEVPDMNLGDVFDEGIQPDATKQLVPIPPTYEQSLEDILAGNKEIYVDPQYFPQEAQELPPEYDDDDEIDYALDDEDMENEILNDYLKLPNYDSVEKVLNQPEMTPKTTTTYLNNILKDAKLRSNQLKGYMAAITKEYNSGAISEAVRQVENKRIDNARATLKSYIKYHENKVKTMKGYGIRRVELITGEILAGNTSIQMRNTGVAILDTLLKMSTINRPQYSKLYGKYFNIIHRMQIWRITRAARV